ncbi:MAG: hypothetical protein JXA09_17710 [Anaerolineae bacterium]|nr:hypothetical protein [Anaerolineae bacterium]
MGADTFWNGVATYNEAWWPLQAVLIAVAAFLTYRVVARPGPRTDVWLKAFLSIAFAWNGIVVFLFYLRNPISMATGTPLFVLVAVLFAVDIWAQRTTFRLPGTRWRRVWTFAWLALVVAYPLIGWAILGHAYPQALLPTMPCPLTVYAIALVAGAAPHADRMVFVALLPWALLALPKCFGALDCYEDCILFASGVYGLVVLIRTWKRTPAAEPDAAPSVARAD